MYTFSMGFYQNFNFAMPMSVFNSFQLPNNLFVYNAPLPAAQFAPTAYNSSPTKSYTFKPISIKSFNIDTDFSTKSTLITNTQRKSSSTKRSSGDFDTMLRFVLKAEGGYVANDCGQACNKGIQQSTYDSYRSRQGLAKKDVKYITDSEVRDIYYNDYYVASGADKIKDQTLALQVFDTAVNMGVSASKKMLKNSNNDAELFAEL